MPVYTLFSQPPSPTTLTADTGAYTMGVQISVSQAATLTAIWFFSPAGAGALPQSISVFQVTGAGTGTLIHAEVPSWSGAAGSGWIRAAFASPPSLSPGTNYKACIVINQGVNEYGATSLFWSSGAGSAGITNGPLSAPNNAGADQGQDTFTVGGALTYPATSFNASNYWIDPEVTTQAAITPSTNITVCQDTDECVRSVYGLYHARGEGAGNRCR